MARIFRLAIPAFAVLVLPVSAAQAVLHGAFLESRMRAGDGEVNHFGTLSDFNGSTRSTYPTVATPSTVIASARYVVAPDRLSIAFEFDHYRDGRDRPAPYYPENEVGVRIDALTDYRFEVSGGYAFSDPSAAAHTEFGYSGKLYGPDLPAPGGGRDYRFLYGASSSRDGVSAIEFGPQVDGEISAGTLSVGTQGILEAGQIYDLSVFTFFHPLSEEADASTAQGTGWFTLTLTPIPEPGTASLLGLGLALTNLATRAPRRSR